LGVGGWDSVLHMDNDPRPHDFIHSVSDDGPRLGLATTEELYRELICRHRMEGGPHDSPGRAMGMNRALVLAEQLGGLSSTDREYRTVGHG
jgi:hypothetical protein